MAHTVTDVEAAECRAGANRDPVTGVMVERRADQSADDRAHQRRIPPIRVVGPGGRRRHGEGERDGSRERDPADNAVSPASLHRHSPLLVAGLRAGLLAHRDHRTSRQPYRPATGVSNQPISGFGAVKNCEEMCLGPEPRPVKSAAPPERVGEWSQVELLGPVKRWCWERWKQACTVCPLHRHHAGSVPHPRARSRPRTKRVRFGMRSSALANCAAASPPRPRVSRNSPYIS